MRDKTVKQLLKHVQLKCMTKEQQKKDFKYYDISLYGQNPDHNLPKAC